MSARRTYFRDTFPAVYMSAVQAHPCPFALALIVRVILKHLRKFSEAFAVNRLHVCYLVKCGCCLKKPFLFCNIAEFLVHVLILFHLVVLR